MFAQPIVMFALAACAILILIKIVRAAVKFIAKFVTGCLYMIILFLAAMGVVYAL